MADSVYRVTEVIGVSSESWEAAARTPSRRPRNRARPAGRRGPAAGRDDRERPGHRLPRPARDLVQVPGRRRGGDVTALSYAHGASTPRCSARRSATNLRRTVASDSATARRSSSATRASAATLRRARRAGRPRRARRCSRPGCSRATASASGARTASSGWWSSTRPPRVGAILVNINPAYRTSELEYALNQSGCRLLVARDGVQGDPTTCAMLAEVRAGTARRSSASCSSARRLGRRWSTAARRRRRRALRERERPAAVRRPDQHPVHDRHDGLPQGRDAPPPQHPQQRLLRRRGAAATRDADRVCIPVPFYHCFGMVHGQPRVHDPRRLHGRSRRGVRPARRRCEAVAGRALHVALRRADDVHRRARAPELRRVRPVAACAPASWPARRARSR